MMARGETVDLNLAEFLPARYEPYYSLESEGNRIALATCSRCGAAVILDTDGPRLHDAWHGGTVETDAAEAQPGAKD